MKGKYIYKMNLKLTLNMNFQAQVFFETHFKTDSEDMMYIQTH